MQTLPTFIIQPLLPLLLCCSSIAADNVVVESLEGESYVVQVDEQDRFFDVVDSIQECLAEGGSSAKEMGAWESFKMYCLPKSLSSEQMSKRARAEARSYEGGMTPPQAGDVAYIVKTLANSSLPKIKSAESSLKKAGDRIDVVHPLQFLLCIFTNEELKVCLRNLQGRAWVWKDFLGGLTETLAEENARGNIAPYLGDFAQRVQVNVKDLAPLVQSGKWERFVNRLIELVPRASGSDRYNM